MLTATKLTATQWRVLNGLQDRRAPGQACSIADAINHYGASCDDVVYLEEQRLVEVRIGDLVISFADQYSGRAGRLDATSKTTMRLTSAGTRRVLDDPTNRVIRALAGGSQGRRVDHVRRETRVGDAILLQMEDAGLIETGHHLVRLADFRNLRGIPGDGKIRLTRKGRAYYTQDPGSGDN